MVNPNQSDRHKVQAFDCYAKKTLKYTARDYYRKTKKRRESEVLFSELSDEELTRLSVTDKYSEHEYSFDVLNWTVCISDPGLADALRRLPGNRRDIVLLSFFLDMTDKEIGERLELANSTVASRRVRSLKKLRVFMEGKNDEQKQDIL